MRHYPRMLEGLKKRFGSSKVSGKLVFIIIGIASTLWFLFRVIPKPSRATYPCMKAAFPFMSGLVIYLITLTGGIFSFRSAKKSFLKAKYLTAGIFLVISIVFAFVFFIHDTRPSYANTHFADFTPPDGVNNPIGTPRGIIKGGVVWVWNPDATDINCTNTQDDAYFESFNTNQVVVDSMVKYAILNLTNAADIKSAWDSLFIYHNAKKGRGRVAHADGEMIFIKINNGSAGYKCDPNINYEYVEDVDPDYAIPYYITETSPQVVLSILKQLINVYGVKQTDIAVGDPVAHIYSHNYTYWHPKYPNVKYVDRSSDFGRTALTESTTASITYSDNGTVMTDAINEKLYSLMENAKYLINMAALKGHEVAGISLCAKNHFGSNTRGGAGQLHAGLIDPNTDGNLRSAYKEYRVQVDIMGSSKLGGNTVLFFVDGLWGGNAGGEGVPIKWVMAPFNNNWPNSIFVSQDQVALESVCYDFLRTEFTTENHPGTASFGQNRRFDYPNMPGVDDYLHQAADSTNNWPAGIKYSPDGPGHVIGSLGVHEHWNNATNKMYSQNFGTGNGIKLIAIPSNLVGIKTPVPIANSSLLLFPIPVKNNMTVSYNLKQSSSVKIDVCDINGQVVKVLQNNTQPAGLLINNFNIDNKLSAGLYFCRLTISNKTENYSTSARFQVIK